MTTVLEQLQLLRLIWMIDWAISMNYYYYYSSSHKRHYIRFRQLLFKTQHTVQLVLGPGSCPHWFGLNSLGRATASECLLYLETVCSAPESLRTRLHRHLCCLCRSGLLAPPPRPRKASLGRHPQQVGCPMRARGRGSGVWWPSCRAWWSRFPHPLPLGPDPALDSCQVHQLRPCLMELEDLCSSPAEESGASIERYNTDLVWPQIDE